MDIVLGSDACGVLTNGDDAPFRFRFPGGIENLFWSEDTRAAVASRVAEGNACTLGEDLIVAVALGLALTVAHALVSILVLKPVIRAAFGSSSVRLPFQSKELAAAYRGLGNGLPDPNMVKKLSKMLGKTVSQINAWFRVREKLERNEVKVTRVGESIFRLATSLVVVGSGLSVSLQYTWRSGNTGEFWTSVSSGFPLQDNVRTYYVLIELPLYLHRLVWQLKDLGRRDFWEMFVHHALVVVLLVSSYAGNFILVGCATLFYHDITEIFLELAKIFRYFQMQTMCDLTFTIFAAVWGLCRLCYFPSRVIRSTLYESGGTISTFAWWFFNALLGCILALNVYWFKIIAGVTYGVLWAGVDGGKGDRKSKKGESTDFETESDATDSDSYLSDFSDSGWKHSKVD